MKRNEKFPFERGLREHALFDNLRKTPKIYYKYPSSVMPALYFLDNVFQGREYSSPLRLI